MSTHPVPEIPGVTLIYPPRWLRRLVGQTPARLLVSLWVGCWRRPDIVGGFHLLINGLVAILLAPLVGARSLYFCVGGPAEVAGGGVYSETALFTGMESPDAIVEERLIKAVSACDLVIVMGSRAREFLRSKGVDTNIHIVPGGIDPARFRLSTSTASIDLITVGRLSVVKRLDVLLEAVGYVAREMPDIRAVILGDGRCRDELERLALKLGVSRCVRLVGHQSDVHNWLRRSRLFVLTSDSEGLSLAMMEAMMCGLPVVVSDVGDLGDLVEDGVNGYLVPPRSPKVFADRILALLRNEQRLASFSLAARRAALRYEFTEVTRKWDQILASWG